MVRPAGFSPSEVAQIRRWATDAGLEILHLPGDVSTGLVSTFLRSPDRAGFIEAFPRNIRPTWDDSPYFFSFSRWSRPAAAAAQIREPSHISQGNPMFVLGQLALVLLAIGGLLIGPLVHIRRRGGAVPPVRAMAFFGCIGIGFIAVELALIQKLTLVIGHPLRALSVVLAGVLLSTGLGALMSRDWVLRGRKRLAVPAGLLAGIGLFLLGHPALEATLTPMALEARAAAVLVLIAPLGLILGVPFAWGMRQIGVEHAPWAWAANALGTVLGSMLAVVLSMLVGFSAVMWAGAASSALGFLVWRGRA
jgi:hypothetical protein